MSSRSSRRTLASNTSSTLSTPAIEDEYGEDSFTSTPWPRHRSLTGSDSSSLGSTDHDGPILAPHTSVPNDVVDPGSEDEMIQTSMPLQERKRLLQSITGLREHLNTSTATLNNLRTRNCINEAEIAVAEKKLQHAIALRHETQLQADEDMHASRLARTIMQLVLLVLFGLIAAYCMVGWYNGPEMSYIRRRRREVLGV